MGGDQGVDDWRPTIIAFACSRPGPRLIRKGTAYGVRVHKLVDRVLARGTFEQRRLLCSSGQMFSDALDCDEYTALSLAYTLHVSANHRPI